MFQGDRALEKLLQVLCPLETDWNDAQRFELFRPVLLDLSLELGSDCDWESDCDDDEPFMPPLLLRSELLEDEPLIPPPRFRSGLFELPTLPLRLELFDDDPRFALLEDEPLIPLLVLLMSSLLVAELPMPSPLRRSERPLELEVLPVLPTLERSLLRVLPTLLEAPKPLVLLSELLFELSAMVKSSDCNDSPTSLRSIHAGKAGVIDRTPSATSPVSDHLSPLEIAARELTTLTARPTLPMRARAAATARADSCSRTMLMHRPPLLSSGARVALIAPSGPLRGRDDLDRAIASVKRMGWEPVPGGHVLDRTAYLAGSDEDRAADLNWAASAQDIDGVWCIRGGYGAMRLLPLVDYDAWRRHPKTLIGYSDITALHAAIGGRAELVTFHGPTAREPDSPLSSDSLCRVLVCGEDPCGIAPDAIPFVPGRVAGRLVGGNLALIAALTGTPYAPDLAGGILVLEDVNESIYRIDRLLAQLRLCGAVDQVAGIAFGRFSDVPAEANDDDQGVERVLRDFARSLGKPCLAGIPMGHGGPQWTIPLGATAELDTEARSLRVRID